MLCQHPRGLGSAGSRVSGVPFLDVSGVQCPGAAGFMFGTSDHLGNEGSQPLSLGLVDKRL